MERTWLILLVCLVVGVIADSTDIRLRIQETHDLLMLQGPNQVVLSAYDVLTAELEQGQDVVGNNDVAQIYYKKALVELSLNKVPLAVDDLLRTLELDPTLMPATKKLIDIWMERGQFDQIKCRFTQADQPAAYGQMSGWEQAYEYVQNILSQDKIDAKSYQRCMQITSDSLLRTTPAYATAYELHAQCAKGFARKSARFDPEVEKLLVNDYAHIVKVAPQKNLSYYPELAQYLLYSEVNFIEGWNVIKTCLRIDNEFKPCGDLTKYFSRLQDLLKTIEEYSILDGYLYPNTDQDTDFNPEAFDLDFEQVAGQLFSKVKVPKREQKNLPPSVQITIDYLLFQAKQFVEEQFGDLHVFDQIPFVQIVTKLACHADIVANPTKKSNYCEQVSEIEQPFLPKHIQRVDMLLKKKKYQEAQKILESFGNVIRKTDMFKERWRVIEQVHAQQQQRQQQQQYQQYQQHQQRQRQYQQQQQQAPPQSHFDRSKDYYKILDVAKDADDKTIKKAYRAQTLKYHPDKYKGDDLDAAQIEAKMQDINEAYEVLSDAKSREDYNRGLSGNPQQQHNHQGSRGQQQQHAQFHEQMRQHFMNMDNMGNMGGHFKVRFG